MQPVAQRDLARLRARRLALRDDRSLLLIAPASASRRPRQDFNATETVPINWQITWHTIPLPRMHTRQVHPIAVTRRKVGVRLRLLFKHEGITLKKTLHASEQDRADVARRRTRWKAYQGRLDPKRLVFIDETPAVAGAGSGPRPT